MAKDPDILHNKVGAVGGDRIGGQEIALQSIHHFYIISEMIPAGGGSFGANPGGTFRSQDRIAEGAAEDGGGAPLHAQDHEPDDEDAGGGRGEDIPKRG